MHSAEPTPWWEAHHGAWLPCVKHTTELDSVVWCKLQTVEIDSAGVSVCLCGGMHTGKFLKRSFSCTPHSAVWCTLRAESDSSVWCPLWRRTPPYDAHWYPGKIKKEFENILVCLSGSQVGSNHDKNRGKQCRWSLGRMKIFLIISVTPQPNCNCIVKVNTLSLSLRPNLQYPPVALTATFLCKTAFNTQWEK